MKGKSIAAAILVILVILGISGCRDRPDAPAANERKDLEMIEKKEPQVFSVLYNDKETHPYREDWLVLQEYSKRKNVILDMHLGSDKEFDVVIARVFESGSVPDIVLKCWPEQIEDYAYDGKLLPFSDYEELMPHYQTYLARHGLRKEVDSLRLSDGRYYILPGFQRKIQVQQWIYRKDLFEKHGLGIPESYDRLFEALETLKDLYPETTPISASWGGAHLFAMMGAGYGISAGWNGNRHYDFEKDRWLFSPATSNWKEMYVFLNRCYQAGILDPSLFTQSNQEFIDKIVDGRVLTTVTWITSGFGNWNEQLEANGIAGGEWAPLPVPESTVGIRAVPGVDCFRTGLICPAGIARKPYFEDLLRFIDWAVYSEEGMVLCYWGVEGVTFENTDSGRVFLPQIKTAKSPEGTVNISTEYGLNLMFNLNEQEDFEDYKKPPEIVRFLEVALEEGTTAPLFPRLILNEDESEAAEIISERIDPYVEQIKTKFITGELDIRDYWNEYLLELEKRGYRSLETIWNDSGKADTKS